MARPRVPNPHCIAAGGDDTRPVRAEAGAVDHAFVLQGSSEGLPRPRVPNSPGLVIASGDDTRAVRAEAGAVDDAIVL